MKARKSFLRLLQEPRGTILQLLRRQPSSAGELAAELKRTKNAVRIQLAKMEKEGLVRKAGKRTAFRKPEYLYELAPEAEQLFHRAYGPLVHHLLAVFSERMSEAALRDALDAVAMKLADGIPPAEQWHAPVERAETAVAIVVALGGAAGIEEEGGSIIIRAWSCPFSEVSPSHPELCGMVATMLSQVTGLTLKDRCDRFPAPPRCAFEVAA